MPRGRPTNEERARRAAEAAEQANQAAETVNELPVESLSVEPQEEKDNLVRRPPRNETRRQAMEEIEARDLQSKSETGLKGQLGLTDDEKPKEEPTPQDLPPPTAESMLQGGKFSPATVRVKIDGQEFDVEQAEVDGYGGVRAYQTAKAAENRLEEARRTLEEFKKEKASLQETKKQDPDAFLKENIDKLRFGTPDEAAAVMTEILSKRTPQFDQNMIVEMAADRIRHDQAVKTFDKEFTDIAASQDYLELVMYKRGKRLEKGHPGDWDTFYRSLGNEVRKVMPKQNQQGTTTVSSDTTSQSSDKEARKASITNLPTATQRAALPEEPKQETREEIFAQMRKKRGLPTT